ncbi:phosphotransferase enzyme family protein [Paenibacillus daejeonensis]|uniref:phosphotransferase enzyme family protein n=1 Tax=Paenibacillus daejeonensis TaxID=135193 RepID=UPI0003736966|nr:phosphotransferase [Paenibacillus daejeonensis]
MKEFFRYDTDENRQSLLRRARKVALTAIQRYDLAWEHIQFIQLSDTITYKIETNVTNHNYLLRIHSDRLTQDEIRSELQLLQTLNKGNTLLVPEGVASDDGSYVLEVETEAGYRCPYVTMMRWVEGEPAGREFTDTCVYNMGELIGRLHNATGSFKPPANFARPKWGADQFRRKLTRLSQYYSCFLSDEAWMMYQEAAEKVLTELHAIPENDQVYGLIHADLHTGNMVFVDDQPFLIDFGRCGYGYYLYDIAGTMLGLWPKHRWMLIQGYERIRKLEANYVRQLECFFCDDHDRELLPSCL